MALRLVPPVLLLAWAMPLGAAEIGTKDADSKIADAKTIASCLDESGVAPRGCVGAVAVVCARQALNDGARDDVACAHRETIVWRDRLATASQSLSSQLDPEAQKRFGSLQDLWLNYSTQKCGFLAESAPPPRAARIEADCELREVAARALEVDRLLRRRGLADTADAER